MESEIRIRRQMIEIGKRIYQSGMVAANDGNLSVRISKNEILCTPTGISKGYMTEECLCKINLQGEVLSCQDGFRPSSEMKMHLKVYEKRPDVRAVVHAHPPYATTFAIGGQALNRAIISESIVSLGCVPVAEYGLPSTQEIPDAIAPYLDYFDALLLAHHGALTYGKDLTEAYYRMESVELYARLLYQSKMMEMDRELDADTVHKLCLMREKAGMKNPETVCSSKKLLFESCHECIRRKNLLPDG